MIKANKNKIDPCTKSQISIVFVLNCRMFTRKINWKCALIEPKINFIIVCFELQIGCGKSFGPLGDLNVIRGSNKLLNDFL